LKTKITTSEAENAKFIWPLLIALVITLFLIYIDEGFYNFKWMLNIGNWIAFLIYLAVIYGALLLVILPCFRFAPKFVLTVAKFTLIIFIVLFLWFIISR
jgi:hypothetical protein